MMMAGIGDFVAVAAEIAKGFGGRLVIKELGFLGTKILRNNVQNGKVVSLNFNAQIIKMGRSYPKQNTSAY